MLQYMLGLHLLFNCGGFRVRGFRDWRFGQAELQSAIIQGLGFRLKGEASTSGRSGAKRHGFRLVAHGPEVRCEGDNRKPAMAWDSNLAIKA